MNTKAIQELLLLVEKYGPDQHIPHLICPSCTGGRSNERSLVVSREGRGIRFRCYRASCGVSGRVTMEGSPVVISRKSEFVPQPFDHETTALTLKDYEAFEEHYELTPDELLSNCVVKTVHRNSYVFPVFNLYGYTIGQLERWYGWQNLNITRKAKFYKQHEGSVHYVPMTSGVPYHTMMIVEDTLSAIKCSRYVATCALLGTVFSSDLRNLLIRAGVRNVILCLDPDARDKMSIWVRGLRTLFSNVKLLFLEADPKDTPSSVLENKIGEI